MKRLNIKTLIGAVMITWFMMGCSKILDETPRSIFTPEYFKSTNGVMGGLYSMYGHTRNIWGTAGWYNSCLTGTDEVTYGASGGTGLFTVFDVTGVGGVISPTNDDPSVLWSNAFPNINTANGIIENATAVGTISPALIAEARFFRAFDYFMLVQTFGGVPLDLGAGELKFNTSTARTSKRNTVAEVYTKAIFPDLDSAVNELPITPRVTGGASKTLARFYLAKAYLTYAWWLENPNSIPTYPLCDRTDPNGHNAAWYYQQAYNLASTAIAAPGPYGLQATYYDVNVATNDRNNECMLYADHTQSSALYNQGSLSYSVNSTDNIAAWMTTFNYTNMTSSKTAWSSPTTVNSVQRISAQGYGRPWVRMAPTIEVFTQTFADKTNDSRYDGTFQLTYRGDWDLTSLYATNPTLYNANDMIVKPGDAILSFLPDESAGAIDYSNSTYKSNIGAGVLPGRADWVISPSGLNRIVYPNIWKISCYRTDNNGGLGNPNAGSTRPYVIAKFSELFFVAAEAAVKGATTSAITTGAYLNDGSAKGLINVIRARAGKWRWNNAGNVAKVADNSAAMIAATPATIDINYILSERSREYYGEGYRWHDLVRTQKWAELSTTYTIGDMTYADHTPKPFTRNITKNLYLRPIPQGQLDAMEMSDAEKAAYQNPGY